MAETYFWAAYLDVDTPLRAWAQEVDLGAAVHELPLGVVADIVVALSYDAKEFETQVGPYRERIMERYQREMGALYIEDAADTLLTHFIVPFEVLNRTDSGTGGAAVENPFHSEAIRRIEMMRYLAPGRQQYGSQGYGHHLGIWVLPTDETSQPGVSVQALPPRWLPRANATFRLLSDWVRRPATWRDHVQPVLDLRRSAVNSLRVLRGYLFDYFRTQATLNPWKKLDLEAWERTKLRVQRAPKLPRTAVDEWGFSAESLRSSHTSDRPSSERSDPERARHVSVLDAHKAYLQTLSDYTRPLGNFLDQAVSVLIVNSMVGRAASPELGEQQRRRAARLGVRTDLDFLSAHNLGEALKHLAAFQRQFRNHVGHLLNERELAQIERQETELMPQVWRLWHLFATSPNQHLRAPQDHADEVFHSVLEGFRRELQQRFNEIRSEAVTAEIFSETIEHEGRAALWLRYDVGSPIDVYSAFQRILELLQVVFGKVQYRTFEMAAVDLAWPTILVVPSVAGQNLEGAMWRLTTSRFFEGGAIDTTEWWNFVPQKLPEGFDEVTGLRVLRHPRAQTIRQLQETVTLVCTRAAHISDLGRLQHNLSHVGDEVAQSYITIQSEQLSAEIQRAIDLLAAALEDRPDDRVLATRRHLQESLEILLKIRNFLFPNDQQQEGQWAIEMRDMPEWVERLQKSLSLLDTARLLRTADALESVDLEPVE